jgi:hypothetical protein
MSTLRPVSYLDGVTVTPLILILEVFGSNLDQNTGYPDPGFRDCPHSLQPYAGMVRRLNYSRFLPNPSHFIICQSNIHSTLCGLII